MIRILKRGQGFTNYNPSMRYPLTYYPSYDHCFHYPIEEVFIPITEKSVPNIAPFYLVSNFGRIFHRFLNDFLTINIDSKGYSYKPLLLLNKQQINVRVHRIVLMEFNYVPGCEKLLVNHKDGNKINNIITNLEWCTYSENIYHAYNVLNLGRTHSSKYSDESLINSICKDLQDGKLYIKDIGQKYNVPEDLVFSILYGKAHKEISKNYTFSQRKSKFSTDDINNICQILSTLDNPIKPSISNNNCRLVLQQIGLADSMITQNLIELIRNIYLRKTFRKISQNYIW